MTCTRYYVVDSVEEASDRLGQLLHDDVLRTTLGKSAKLVTRRKNAEGTRALVAFVESFGVDRGPNESALG